MATRLFRHTLVHKLVSVGADSVIGGCDLPSESSLNNVWGQISLQGSGVVSVRRATMYKAVGRVVPNTDLDTAQTYDAIWDQTVPKDADFSSSAIDLNESANAASFFEPGEPNWAALADLSVADDDKKFFSRRKLLTFVNSPRGFLDGTPDTYFPGDFFTVKASKRIPVEYGHVALFAVGLPAFDDVTTTALSTLDDESRVLQLKYIEVVLEQAWMGMVGLTETGAETPWEDAANMIGDFLEPTVSEETAAQFDSSSAWDCYADMTWDITVPGRKTGHTLSVAG